VKRVAIKVLSKFNKEFDDIIATMEDDKEQKDHIEEIHAMGDYVDEELD
jgi:hypothetical protein